MTKDEAIDLVKQVIGDYSRDQYWPFFTEDLVQFANLVESRTASYSAALLQSQAATLATVTPLVQELLGAVQMANHGGDCATLHGGTRCDCWKHALNDKARAFLSGATKESTDHADQA